MPICRTWSALLCLAALGGQAAAASLSSLDNVSYNLQADPAQACNYLVDLGGADNLSPCGSGTAHLVIGGGHPDVVTHWAVAAESAASYGHLHGAVSIAADGNYAAESGDLGSTIQTSCANFHLCAGLVPERSQTFQKSLFRSGLS